MADQFEYDVFLSHSSHDKPAVRKLAERLKADGLQVWLDEWVIQPGDMIGLKVEEGLEKSRTLVLVMSHAAFDSEWVALERHTALFRDPTNHQRRFIPLRLDDCEITDALKQYAYVDWREQDSTSYLRLLDVCHRPKQQTQQPNFRESTVDEAKTVCILSGHQGSVSAIAVSADGKTLASGCSDQQLRIWNTKSQTCLYTVDRYSRRGASVAITADGQRVVAAAIDHSLQIFDVSKSRCIGGLDGHKSTITAVAFRSDERCLATGSHDGTVRFWDFAGRRKIRVWDEHSPIVDLACAKEAPVAISATQTGHIALWDLESCRLRDRFQEMPEGLAAVAIDRQGQTAVSGANDGAITAWDVSRGEVIGSFEGHLGGILSLGLSEDGRFVISGSADGTVRVWYVQTGECLMTLGGHRGSVTGVHFSPNCDQIVSCSEDGTIRIWRSESLDDLLKTAATTTRYTNAKVLLVGDSGVGKSGLAVRLTKHRFEPTFSTDAHWATQLRLPHGTNTTEVDREIWLWDFAGQADYRLIHQLFMDETALAVLVFNPQSERPFDGLGQWNRDLMRAARREFTKLLVAGRCDRGGLMVSRKEARDFASRQGFIGYLETSALTGDGCEQLRDEIVRRIDWDSIPWTASPRIFKLLKDGILDLRDQGVVLLRMSELKQQLEMRLVNEAFTLEELRAVVGLLAGPGLVSKLEFGEIVMLQPEWINKYAAAVIRSVRAHVGEIGVIDEAKVLAGELNYTMDVVRQGSAAKGKTVKLEMQRLEASNEAIVLRAMHQMFVDHGLCVREELDGGGRQLVFPSYFKKELPTDPGHPPILVTYQFDGHAEEIYATLVVQLWRTKAFENGQLWRYAADFRSGTGARLGLKMVRAEDRKPEISVYFAPNVQDDTKVTFIKYVHEHLLQKARGVTRLRTFVCPHCGHPVRDSELAREILEDEGPKAEIRCQQRRCDQRFSLWDAIEKKFASEEFQERVKELESRAKIAIDNESRELILEGHARVITGEAGQIFRGYTGSDHGIDGEIEFKDNSGQASGKRLYLQLKSGDSYLYQRKSDGAEVFQIKRTGWADYWQQQPYPVMLVIRTSDGQIRWMNVTRYLEENHDKGKTAPVTQIAFDGQPFTALNVQRMRSTILELSNS